MNPQQRVLLTAAFEALGPERVTRSLEATGHRWKDCFLAIAAYGEPCALAREMVKPRQKENFVGPLVGVPVQVVKEVARLWDDDEQSFRALAAEWLELSRTAVPIAPAGTACAQP